MNRLEYRSGWVLKEVAIYQKMKKACCIGIFMANNDKVANKIVLILPNSITPILKILNDGHRLENSLNEINEELELLITNLQLHEKATYLYE